MPENPTPMILQDEIIKKLLPQLDVQGELRVMFEALAQGKAVQPAQTVTEFPNKDGDFITYLGVVEAMGVFGAKLSPYIVTDSAPIITAWTALMSMRTGQPLVWCDAGRLTTERTAGTTALAVDYLARAESKKLAIIGSGAVAQAHLRHVLGHRDWDQISVHSPTLAEDQERQAIWQSLSEKAAIADDVASCVADADVVMLCTSSGTPVIDPADIGKHALITSISTNAPNAHEVPPSFLNEAEVYCDYAATTPGAAAEMRIATTDHGWSVDQIKGDLGSLACDKAPLPDYTKPAYFRSVGLGLEDIAMAYGIWKLSQAQDR